MRKYIGLLLLVLLSGISMELFAADVNLKSFSSSKIPPFISGGGVRAISTSLTPNKAVTFKAEPLFEWSKPVCTVEAPCSLIIERPFQNNIEEDTVFEDENVTSNSFKITNDKLKLEPGIVYIFNLTDSTASNNLNLVFYKLSESESEPINCKLNSIESADDYSKEKAELDLFIDQGLWFDTINALNALIDKYGDKEELTTLKEQLYREQ